MQVYPRVREHTQHKTSGQALTDMAGTFLKTTFINFGVCSRKVGLILKFGQTQNDRCSTMVI